MAECTCPCAIFPADDPIRDDSASALPCSMSCSMTCSMSLPNSMNLPNSTNLPLRSPTGRNRLSNGLRNGQHGKYSRSALHAIATLDLDGGVAIEQHIHARAKLDEPYPLAAFNMISHL